MSHEMLSVEKLMIVVMKLSRRRTPRMAFQSLAGSPMRRQMDSMAILIILGGLARVLISTRCCLFIDFTAVDEKSLIIEAATCNDSHFMCYAKKQLCRHLTRCPRFSETRFTHNDP